MRDTGLWTRRKPVAGLFPRKGVVLAETKKCGLAVAILGLLVFAFARGGEAAQPYWATFSDALKSGGSGPRMIGVNGGSFRMGCVSGIACENKEPVRQVSIAPFALSVYEVTRGEFRRFVKQTGYVTDGERAPQARPINPFSVKGGCSTLAAHQVRTNIGFTWKNPNFPQTDEHPVVCVSWVDAQAYVEWLADETDRPYRLPSEAEWEYAARAGATGAILDEEVVRKVSYCANSRRVRRGFTEEEIETCLATYPSTEGMGGRQPNAFGLHYMTGNAVEWVEDCWHTHFRGAPADGSAWTGGLCPQRVMRFGKYAPHWGAPLEARGGVRARKSLSLAGFRVALPTSN